jgi:hypothetical protein
MMHGMTMMFDRCCCWTMQLFRHHHRHHAIISIDLHNRHNSKQYRCSWLLFAMKVGLLNANDSIKLLRSFLPTSSNNNNGDDTNVSDDNLKKVAKKCGNVALALSIVGRTMASSDTLVEFKRCLNCL